MEFYDFSTHRSGVMSYAVGRERGHVRVKGKESEVKLVIRMSRFYRREYGRRKQVHHHGFIDEPALLVDYEMLVR